MLYTTNLLHFAPRAPRGLGHGKRNTRAEASPVIPRGLACFARWPENDGARQGNCLINTRLQIIARVLESALPEHSLSTRTL